MEDGRKFSIARPSGTPLELSEEEAYEARDLLTFLLEHRPLDRRPLLVCGVFLEAKRSGKWGSA